MLKETLSQSLKISHSRVLVSWLNGTWHWKISKVLEYENSFLHALYLFIWVFKLINRFIFYCQALNNAQRNSFSNLANRNLALENFQSLRI